MHVQHIDHFTLRVQEAQLPALLDFYVRVLRLREGDRPSFSFPGHWLYARQQALVDLAGNAPFGESEPSGSLPTGKLNHISLRATGLKETPRAPGGEGRGLAGGPGTRHASAPGVPARPGGSEDRTHLSFGRA